MTLINSPEIDQERVLQLLHDLELFEDIAHFIALHTLEFVHILHGVHFLCVLFLDNAYLEKKNGMNDLFEKIWIVDF